MEELKLGMLMQRELFVILTLLKHFQGCYSKILICESLIPCACS